MEGSLEAVEVRVNEHDRRLSGLHKTVGGLSTTVGDHDSALSGMRVELKETRQDLGEIKESLVDTRRALYIVASTMATFTLSIIGLTATLLNG